MNDKQTLELTREQMRTMGYRVIDMIVEHHARLAAIPVRQPATRVELEERIPDGFPEEGVSSDEILSHLERDVFPNVMHVDHPRFFAFVPSPGNFVAAMGDALASGFNVFEGTWLGGAAASLVEHRTIDWLRAECGLPPGTDGLMLSGGSMANLTALAMARHARGGGCVYFSDQTHSSVERALRVLGFAAEDIRKLPADESSRLPVAALRAAIALDRAALRKPFCVIANAGTTNTGAVDLLPELSALCRTEDLWLHADGAYGSAAVLCEAGRRALRGLDLVDSLSLDPHKWLFQPFEIGCVLVREGQLLKDAFRILPEYLQDVHRMEEAINYCDRGVQLSRGFRALKLWMSLQYFGVKAFRAAVARGFELAQIAEERLRENPRWEILSPAQMAIVAFRYRFDSESGARHQRLVDATFADGFAGVSSTALGGDAALRLCTINPRTTDLDIRDTIARLERLAESV